MNKHLVFTVIALLALTSAFTTRTTILESYKYISEDDYYYIVDPNPISIGSLPGQFSCYFSLNKCCVKTEITPIQGFDGYWRIPKYAYPMPVISQGNFVIHL